MSGPRTGAAADERGLAGWAGWVVAGAVALFWVLTLVAGALASGYSPRADYISSLAGQGSEVAVLGIAALLALPLAHAAAAVALGAAPPPRDERHSRRIGTDEGSARHGGWGRGVAVGALAVAALAGLVVAVFRTPCPLGAAGCGSGTNTAPGDLAGLVHGLGVYGYELALLVTMGLVAWRLARTRPVAAALTLAAGVASVVLALQIDGPDLGLWQRAWLVVNTGWLVVAATRFSPPR